MRAPTAAERRRRFPAVLLLAVLAAALAPGPAAGAAEPVAAEEVRQRAARIVGTPGYQTTLPADGEAEPPPERRSLGPLAGLLTRVVFWLAVIGVVVLLLKMLIDFLARSTRYRPPAEETPAAADPAPPPDLAPLPLPDADALAREGRFGEAVHALLLAALAHLSERRGAPLQPSLTSREVLALGEVEGEPRSALGELVAAVERFLFAGRPLGEADWERCRSAFRELRVGAGGAA